MTGIGRIGGVGISTILGDEEVVKAKQVQKPRIDPYAGNESFSKEAGKIGERGGLTESLPEEARAEMEQLLSGMNDEERAAFVAAGRDAIVKLASALGSASGADTGTATTILTSSFSDCANMTNSQNYEKAVKNYMYMSYAGYEEELGELAYKVKAGLDEKNSLREEITMLNDALSNWPAGKDTIEIQVKYEVVNGEVRKLNPPQTKTLNKDQVKSMVDALGQRKDTISEMNEMDKLDLQDKQQKMSQAVSMISAMLKNEHDTLKGIIGNMRS